ncbi:Adenylosuccinate lyase [Candidatus Promineifilum breve]|uniref:Adenylosuccinate lyase n=1 Tax=Candidatus Promineifilum breve TaxID=1806508 RepID=A0A160SZ52_9CHLR|nr:adenylosuccinate lyase [Candidatus Promineifilum breve]CUS02656.2 Adenylosuccinate lyase [Candidatus Promineifilum breve]
MSDFNHNTFISPFTWRYGSQEMRYLWSELHKRRLMRRVWVALAAAQHVAGLVSAEQLADLERHVDDIDIARALQIERETRHDVMAEIRAYAEQCPVGGGVIHWGATSADITDNVDALRQREAARLLLEGLQRLLIAFARRIDETADLPVMAHTHIQPAEPTTLGYRLAMYAQDLLEDFRQLQAVTTALRGKGFKGAVGTQATFVEMLAGTEMTAGQLEELAMARLDLPCFPIASQTYTRQQDLRVQQVLTGIASSLHKFALDFRLLQSPPFGEWAEPFGRRQVGSSAMPFKRNPINAENICSLARYVAAQTAVAWDNAGQAILERSLDDSANRRLYLPESFLAVDEMLRRATTLVEGMTIDREQIGRNLARYGPFAATERVLVAAVRAGADRQEVHEWLREVSLRAWEAVRREEPNPLAELVAGDARLTAFLPADELRGLMDAGGYVGTAADRARALAAAIRAAT